MKKAIVRVLFILAFIVWIFSFGWMDGIGLEGLLQYLAFMISGSYVILFIYANL